MLILVSYDVPSDRRRTRLAKALEDFGERVQWSVFECRLDEGQVERMRQRVAREIAPAEDSVRIYRFCLDCGEKLEILGLGVPTREAGDYYA